MLSLNIGPLAISVGQALLFFAFAVALIVGKLVARKRDVAVGDSLWNLVIVGFLGARIAFVGYYYSDYGFDPLAWIDIRDGGFEFIAGVCTAGLYAGYLAWRQPALRSPLGAALFAGALAWGLTGGALNLIENQASRPPATVLYALDGTTTNLANLQQSTGNRPMVVNLWATWCPPCRAEMPVLEQAQNQHSNVLFVFVNQGEAAPTIQSYLNKMQLRIEHVLQDRHGNVARQAGSAALPTTLFYDADGRLVDSHLGQLSKATLARALARFAAPPNHSTQTQDTK